MPVSRSRPVAAAAALALCALGAGAEARGAAFEPLFVAGKVVGHVKVVRPDGSTVQMKESHAYPYGSRIEVAESLSAAERRAAEQSGAAEAARPSAMVVLSSDYRFRVGPGSSVTVADEAAADGAEPSGRKVVTVDRGFVSTMFTVPAPSKEEAAAAKDDPGAVVVRTPLCDAVGMAEQNQVAVTREKGGSWTCLFGAPSGKLRLAGRQFKVQRLKHNTEIAVSGTEDFTRIAARRGEFVATFDKGANAVETVPFKSRMVGKIWREYASVGHRMAVSVMVSYPPAKPDEEGRILSYSYLEGQTDVGVEGGAAAAAQEGAGEGDAAEADPFGSFSDDGDDGFGSFGDDAQDSAAAPASDDSASAFSGFEDW